MIMPSCHPGPGPGAADDTSQHVRARLVCEQLNALEADASFVAWPCSETHVQVMCRKVGWKTGSSRPLSQFMIFTIVSAC